MRCTKCAFRIPLPDSSRILDSTLRCPRCGATNTIGASENNSPTRPADLAATGSPAKKPTSEQERMWRGMAGAIIGSGTYRLQGKDESQIEVLAHFLRSGHKKGYEWEEEYRHLLAFWKPHRPLMPSLDEMRRLVERE